MGLQCLGRGLAGKIISNITLKQVMEEYTERKCL